MRNQIDGKIKKERVRKVLDVSKIYEYSYYKKFAGSVLEGVTELGNNGKILIHTSNFIPVLINDKVLNNEIKRVEIIKVDKDNIVYGKLV